MSDEQVRVVTMTHDGSSYTVPWNQRQDVIYDLEEAEDGAIFILRVHSMSQAALEALPEFDGF